ncbi:MAG: hypothetical protein PVJ67_02900 [Candidatus Pacearchaeota archaeon]|jgi:hypothetical protein
MELTEFEIDKGVESISDYLINHEVRAREALKNCLGKKVLVLDWHKRDVVGFVLSVDNIFAYKLATPRGEVLPLCYNDFRELYLFPESD